MSARRPVVYVYEEHPLDRLDRVLGVGLGAKRDAEILARGGQSELLRAEALRVEAMQRPRERVFYVDSGKSGGA